jgi:Lon protease-like protein
MRMLMAIFLVLAGSLSWAAGETQGAVKPESVDATPRPSGARLSQPPAANLRNYLTRLEKERHKREADAAVETKSAEITRSRQQCKARLDALRARQPTVAEKLAGANPESAASQEMQAEAGKCETEARLLQSELDELRKLAFERGRDLEGR